MDIHPKRIVSLCAGVGWLDEGLRAGLDYFGVASRVVAYIERDSYAASVLLARMEDEALEWAAIGDSISDIDERFRGRVDCIVAGFPCQPWSAAGKQRGTDDDRWLWPEIADAIERVGPELVFLENVPGLVSGGGLYHVLDDLAALGFDAEWLSLTAEAVGASHKRERIFILAYRPGGRFRELWESPQRDRLAVGGRKQLADSSQSRSGRLPESNGRHNSADANGGRITMADAERQPGRQRQPRRGPDRRAALGGAGGELANTEREPIRPEQFDAAGGRTDCRAGHEPVPGGAGPNVADADGPGCEGGQRRTVDGQLAAAERSGQSLFAPGPGDRDQWQRILAERPWLAPATEPGVCFLADGQPLVVDESRADQLRCAGNGCVPLQASVAFIELSRRAGLRVTRR